MRFPFLNLAWDNYKWNMKFGQFVPFNNNQNVSLNAILLGWNYTPDFIRGGGKFVLHPSNIESLEK